MRCLDANRALSFLDRSVAHDDNGAFDEHIDQCTHCRELMADAVRARGRESGQRPVGSRDTETTRFDGQRDSDRAALFSSGQVVEHFRIMRLLGRGGMGEVYLARDSKLGRKVALKVILPELLGSNHAIARFQLEARTTAKFSHPNIVTNHAEGEFQGIPYLALEYLEGQSLGERATGQKLGASESMRIALAIVEALAEAHRHGVLHRDLKPANVHLGSEGGVRVLDFGLAKLLQSEGPASIAPLSTRFGGIQGSGAMGTPWYMAPEQWEKTHCSPATDVWALGVILYELISGERPFPAKSVSELSAKVSDSAFSPTLVEGPDVAEELAALIARCLMRDPAKRPTISELMQVLGELLTAPRQERSQREPFRGLDAFGEQHAGLFFGRDAEIASMAERLRRQSMLTLVGPSGVGKSSLVQAGLVPRLQERQQWSCIQMRPGVRPFSALAMALRSLDRETSDEDTGELAVSLASSPHELSLRLRALAEEQGGKVLLFVDQLEEVFTLAADDEAVGRFLHAVCLAADDPVDPIRVVIALRNDFLGQLATNANAQTALMHIMVLRNPEPEALEQVLLKPVEMVGGRYEDPELVAEMIKSVVAQGDERCLAPLPLLQFAADLLWQRSGRKDGVLTRAAYEQVGGVEGALARHADGVLDAFSPEELRIARELLLRLVTEHRTRKILPQPEALSGLDGDAELVVERLIRARLVSVSKPRDRNDAGALLELTHESLIQTWTTLSRWIDESQEDLSFLSEAAQAADLWHKRGRRGAELWSGAALAEALRKLNRSSTPVTEHTTEFLQAAAKRQSRRTWTRRASVAVAVSVLVVVAAVLAASEREAQHSRGLAEQRREQAERGQAEALLEGAREAVTRGEYLEARAKLRSAFQIQDSLTARGLWWQLSQQPLLGHRRVGLSLYAVEIFDDGKTVALANADSAIYLLDTRTGAARPLRGHRDKAIGLAVSPDGRQLVSGDWAGEIRLWDLKDGSSRSLTGHQAGVWGLSFSPDGRVIASASNDRTIRFWDVVTGAVRKVLEGHSGGVLQVQFSPDGKLLASASADQTIRLWDATTGAERGMLEGHKDVVRDVQFAPDGQSLASAGLDGTVRLWSLAQRKQLHAFVGHVGAVYAVQFSSDGRTLFSSGLDTVIRRWDVARRQPVVQSLEGHMETVRGLSSSPDGKLLASGSLDGTVRLWDPRGASNSQVQRGHLHVNSVDFSPDGSMLASGGGDRVILLWNAETGAERRRLHGHTARITSVRIGPRGKTLASGGVEKTVRVWDVDSGLQLHALKGHTGEIQNVGFSHDGRLAVSCGNDRTIRLWDLATGMRRVLRGHEGAVLSVAFHPDGKTLASGSQDRTARTWNVTSGAQRQRSSGHSDLVHSVAFSPDGRSLLSGGADRAVRLWDLAADTSRLVSTLDARVFSVSFAPSGKRIAVSTAIGRAHIVDLDSGESTALEGHVGDVNDIRYSPDGKRVVTAGDDGTVRLWSTEDGTPVWRAPVMLSEPPELLTHRGWISLAQGTLASASKVADWRQAIAQRARLASVDPGTGLSCLITFKRRLETWDTRADRLISTKALRAPREVLAISGGCAVVEGDELHLHRPAAVSKLAAQVSAIGPDGSGMLVAAGKQVLQLDGAGNKLSAHPAPAGVTALVRSRKQIMLGFPNGTIEPLALSSSSDIRPPPLEPMWPSPVTIMLPGPKGTFIGGYANGIVDIWSQKSGARLHHAKLHGRVEHLLLKDAQLYVATDLGDHASFDLSVFQADYCALISSVWGQIPVVWDSGVPTIAAPQAQHRCRQADR